MACKHEVGCPHFFYIGRWRTLGDAIRRIVEDRAMRGVVWTVEGDRLVGRDGAFEMRLRLTLPANHGCSDGLRSAAT